MSRRFFKWFLRGLAGLALLSVTAWAVLFHTEAGARWLWSRLAGDELMAQSVSGTVVSGLVIRDLSLATEAFGLRAGESRLAAHIGLWPLGIELALLDIDLLEIEWNPDASDTNAPSSPGRGLQAPVPVEFGEIVVRQLVVRGTGSPDELSPARFTFSGRWDERLVVEHLQLEGTDYHFRLTGATELASPYRHDLNAQIGMPMHLAKQLGWAGSNLNLTAVGDAELTELRIHQPEGHLDLSGQLSHWLTQPGWSAKGSVTDMSVALDHDASAPLLIRTLQLEAWGTDENFSTNVSGQAGQDLIGDFSWHFSGDGDLSGFQVQDGRLDARCLEATFTAETLWTGGISARMGARTNRFEPDCWIEEWPKHHPLNGDLKLTWHEDALEVTAFDMQIAGSNARMVGSGRWLPGRTFEDIRLEWNDLSWPLEAEPRLESSSGQVQLDGRVDDWRLDGRMILSSPPYPETELSLLGNGNTTSASIRLDRSAVMGGVLLGSGTANWEGPLTWSAHLEGSNIGLATLWPDWPATIDIDLSANQKSPQQGVQILLKGLSGSLHGEALSGAGKIRVEPNNLAFEGLELKAPDSRLELNGSLASGIDFEVNADRPGLLATLAGTEIHAQGQWRGTPANPEIEMDLTLNDLRLAGMEIAQVGMSGNAGPNIENARMEAALEGISLGGISLQNANVVLSNQGGLQLLSLEASSDQQMLTTSVLGELSGWFDTSDWAFRGKLEAFRYVVGDEDGIELRQPAPLNIEPGRIELNNACLQIEPGDSLCLTSNIQDGSMELVGHVQSLPLQKLMNLAAMDIEFSQLLNGKLEWRQYPDAPPSGTMQLSLTPGVIRHKVEDLDEIETGEGEFSFRLDEGQLREGRLSLPLVGLGGAQVDYAISDMALDGTGMLEGRARVEIEDLYPLEVFLPYLANLSGRLSIDTSIGGITSNPHLEGLIMLENAIFDIPAVGLRAAQIELDGRVSLQDQLAVQGALSLGDGEAEIEALLDLAHWEAPRLDLLIDGNDLQIIDLPDLSVIANPGLEIGWSAGDWTVGGQLAIPRARIAPSTVVAERVSESRDVVIVAGKDPNQVPVEARENSVSGQIQVSVGDEVSVDMPALSLSANGKVELNWTGDPVPNATGVIFLDGEIRSYGPRLQVEQGRIRFQGGTALDPRLDIRAERDIFGNTQIQTAGVRVAGTARRPLIEAYTHPVTTEERAWTLLVTGSDFQYGQGVGAFDIGTYIAPRLYISYGISLVDDARTVSARYDLRRGFGIKATSSEEDNGLDISYTIER